VRLITVSACITTALVLPGCGMARPSLAAAYTGASCSCVPMAIMNALLLRLAVGPPTLALTPV
jgi:hypothetical protein